MTSNYNNIVNASIPKTIIEKCLGNKFAVIYSLDFGNVPANDFIPNPFNTPGTTLGQYAEIDIPSVIPGNLNGFNELQGIVISWMPTNQDEYTALGVAVGNWPEIFLAPASASNSGVVYMHVPLTLSVQSLSARVRIYAASLPLATPGPLSLAFLNYPIMPLASNGAFAI